jgi:phosphomannomutase
VVEENVPATPEMRIVVPNRLREVHIDRILDSPVRRISHMDGFKFYLENDNWLMLRFSGTEALLRIFAEADTPEKAEALVAWGKETIDL